MPPGRQPWKHGFDLMAVDHYIAMRAGAWLWQTMQNMGRIERPVIFGVQEPALRADEAYRVRHGITVERMTNTSGDRTPRIPWGYFHRPDVRRRLGWD